jgi:AcrR family transcriptional regulator
VAIQAAPKASSAGDTRQRLIGIAVRLFTRHSFAGTSLQMIADELGVTKAAVYHHFHTREELLLAVLEPLFLELEAGVVRAEALRTPHARAEHALTGFVALAVRNRSLVSVLAGDPGVIEMVRTHPRLGAVIDRQVRLLADVHPGRAGEVGAAVVMSGTACAVGQVLDLDDEELHRYLVEVARRALGLRPPRRPVGTSDR